MNSPTVLRVGTARVDITPTEPVTLSGYASRKDLSKGVHDPLSARVVAFEQDGKRLVLVSTDVLGFYGGTADRIRKAILAACGLEPSELFLAAIHTHSAPTVTLDGEKHPASNVEYTKLLEGRLVAAVGEALAQAAPARLGVGSGSCPVGVNRREWVQESDGTRKLWLGRNPGVMTDREVQVLRISREGGPAAVLFAYPTHSTAMGPGNYLVSGDVHGLAEQFLEEHLGQDMIASGFAGASGDIDPWFRVLSEFKTTNGWVPEAVVMGTMLGEEVAHVLNRIEGSGADAPIQTAFKTLTLPGKPLGQAAAAAESGPAELNLSVGRVGEIAFVGLGGEVFNEIGRAIKTASPFAHTFVITHCNGAAGYLPTSPSYGEGGYEVKTSPFAPAAAEQVIQEAARMLREL